MENPTDQRKAECPYCGATLKKIPSKKTKCPHCGKFMFVRTQPQDRVRVIVTQEDAEKNAQDWLEYGREQEIARFAEMAKEWKETSTSNLREMRKSGVVKTMKIYVFPGNFPRTACHRRDGMVLNMDSAAVGKNIPPFSDCSKVMGCRCYWRPWHVSIK